MSEPVLYAVLFAVGIATGFVNTLAGGGSLLAVPILMMLGLPANIANATNRVAIVAQSISGVGGFHREGRLDRGAIAPVALPTIVGAIGGAGLAAIAPEDVLKPVLLATMIAMGILLAVKPSLVTGGADETPRSPLRHPFALIGLVLAGVYGGFVQAGVGFVLLAVLGGMLRYDVVRANALKAVCTLLFGIAALAVFVVADQVRWIPGAVLGVGSMIGAQLGVRYAVKADPRVLRGILLGSVVVNIAAALLE